MRRAFSFLLTLALLFALPACGSGSGQRNPTIAPTHEAAVPASKAPETSPAEQPDSTVPSESEALGEADSEDPKILIAYFSATNNTENVANHIADILDADLYEIVPETPYTAADLNYNTDCRANREQNDASARPAISGSVNNMERYNVIFLGYPIWWGEAPRIINTFLESYDLSGKTIVPFCTSASSPMGSSAARLQDLAGTAEWLEGQRFSGNASRSTVEAWVDSLNLALAPAS